MDGEGRGHREGEKLKWVTGRYSYIRKIKLTNRRRCQFILMKCTSDIVYWGKGEGRGL